MYIFKGVNKICKCGTIGSKCEGVEPYCENNQC